MIRLHRVIQFVVNVARSLTPSDDESNSDPGTSESPNQYYAHEVLRQADDDRSLSHDTDTIGATNLDAEYYTQSAEFHKSECERPNELIEAQCDVVAEHKAQCKSLNDLISTQKADIDRLTSTSEQNATLLEFYQTQNERHDLESLRTNALIKDFQKANGALIGKFEQLKIDIERRRSLDDHATSSEIILPVWNAEVVVLPQCR